jgi:hypothetical protein
VTWEARQTLTTLEATRPDRASRPCERAALHRDLVGRDLPGSGAVPSRQGRRCAARCARPLGPYLDCPAQLRCLAMNVAPGGDLQSRQPPLQLGRLVGDLQSPFPARTSCSGAQSPSHPDHIDAGRAANGCTAPAPSATAIPNAGNWSTTSTSSFTATPHSSWSSPPPARPSRPKNACGQASTSRPSSSYKTPSKPPLPGRPPRWRAQARPQSQLAPHLGARKDLIWHGSDATTDRLPAPRACQIYVAEAEPSVQRGDTATGSSPLSTREVKLVCDHRRLTARLGRRRRGQMVLVRGRWSQRSSQLAWRGLRFARVSAKRAASDAAFDRGVGDRLGY